MAIEHGRVARITGTLVVARGVPGARMHDLVRVGELGRLGEIIRLEADRASIQVYEETNGLRVGEPVQTTGAPLMAELGPGLLGSVFDGIQRPLRDLHEASGPFIGVGVSLPALDRQRRWRFEPAVAPGDEIGPGCVLGVVDEGGVPHRILAPPETHGRVERLHDGDVTLEEPVVQLDNGPPLTLRQRWPVRRPRPSRGKRPLDRPLLTGQRVFDTFFPVAQGGTVIVPGGFGTGKTVVEHLLAKHCNVDVIVYVGCGERGNEMTALLGEFPRLTDPHTGRPLMRRTVLVANTSNMPVAAREASLYIGMTIAEYYRDMGYAAAVVADSTSRWAEALREIGSRLGEMPGEEGYPPYLASRLASYYERAGVVACLGPDVDRRGSVTVVSAVSPPGGDFSEPVTQASLRVAGGLWALDVSLAQRRHFPAVSWTESYSLYVNGLARWFSQEVAPDWDELRRRGMRLLQKEDELRQVVQVVGVDALPDEERLVLESARWLRESFLRQNGFHPVDAYCPVGRQVATLRLLLRFHDQCRAALTTGTPLDDVLASELWEQLGRLRTVPHEVVDQRLGEIEAKLTVAFGAPS